MHKKFLFSVLAAVAVAAPMTLATSANAVTYVPNPSFNVSQSTYPGTDPITVGAGNVWVTITPMANGNYDVTSWSLRLKGEISNDIINVRRSSDASATVRVYRSRLATPDAGVNYASASFCYKTKAPGPIVAGCSNGTFQTEIDLFRRSSLGSLKAPTSVPVGSQATFTGKLSRVKWESATYSGFAGQNVTLFERDNVYAAWEKVTTRKTDSAGNFKFVDVITQDTQWQVVYFGSGTTSQAYTPVKTITAS